MSTEKFTVPLTAVVLTKILSLTNATFFILTESCLGNRTELEVDVPCSVAYQCYSERESIPQWMPFISSVKVNICSLYWKQ
jgi:uncharacterized membrane protein